MKQALKYARAVLQSEVKAIDSVSKRLGPTFVEAVSRIVRCKGRVITTAIGKPGFIAQKLSATFASIGVPSHYLHPAEAAHGDLGHVAKGDVVIALSNSGATEEVVRIAAPLQRIGATLIAITGDGESPLAQVADIVIDIGFMDEAGPMGLVPTASSAALHALADALAMTVAHERELTVEQYARLHPGGKLGRSVLRVADLMRTGKANPLVKDSARLSEVVVVMTNTPGRPGAALAVDSRGQLSGIFTDGDLRRLAEQRTLDFHARLSSVMGRHPRFVRPDELVLEAAAVMREHQIDQLPVVDGDGRPVGLLDVQDLLAARIS